MPMIFLISRESCVRMEIDLLELKLSPFKKPRMDSSYGSQQCDHRNKLQTNKTSLGLWRTGLSNFSFFIANCNILFPFINNSRVSLVN